MIFSENNESGHLTIGDEVRIVYGKSKTFISTAEFTCYGVQVNDNHVMIAIADGNCAKAVTQPLPDDHDELFEMCNRFMEGLKETPNPVKLIIDIAEFIKELADILD